MKKVLLISLTLILFAQVVVFSGCLPTDACEHVFVQNVSEEYCVSNANCESSAVYVESCKHCGEVGSRQFSYGDKYHKYLDGAECLLCHEEKPLYVLKVDEENYKVTMKFGSFPQSEVKDEELISSLNNLHGELPTATDKKDWTAYNVYAEYQLEDDIMWYKDVVFDNEKYRAVYFVAYKPERTKDAMGQQTSIQYRHGYRINTVYWFKWEPIVWKVIIDDERESMLMTEFSLYGMEFYHHKDARVIEGKAIYPNNYEYSNVRAWLNEDFYNQAFNEREKLAILLTEIDNSAPTTNIYGNPFEFENGVNNYVCNDVEDKIFMPSLVDMTNPEYGFPTTVGDNSGRYFKATDYAMGTGCSSFKPTSEIEKKKERNSYAWTRSPQSYYDFGMRRVDGQGGMSMSTNVDNSSVAPIICLNLDMNG